MSPAMISVLLNALVFLVGLALQGILLAFMLGKMKGAQESFAAQIGSLTDAVKIVQAALHASGENAAATAVRTANLEKMATTVDKLNEAVIEMRAVSALERGQIKSDQEKIHRDLASLNRQLGTLVAEGRVSNFSPTGGTG